MARARLVHKFNNIDDNQNLASIPSNIYKQTERAKKGEGMLSHKKCLDTSFSSVDRNEPKGQQSCRAPTVFFQRHNSTTHKCKTKINKRLQNSCWMAKRTMMGEATTASQHWKGSLRVFVNVQRKCFGNLWVAWRSKTLHGGDLTASLFKLSFIGMFFLSFYIWAWITVNYCRIKHFVAVV